MNALIIPFFSFKKDISSNILLDYHLSRIDKINVDKIYFSTNNLEIENKVINIDNKQITFINNENVWHQENIENAVSMLNDNDKFIITDSDCMVYDYSLFDDIFNWLDEYDIVSNLDCGTRIMPTWTNINNYDPRKEDSYRDLMYNIPIMRSNEFRNCRTRFAATLFGCKSKFYKKYNNVKPDSKFESMEEFSRNVASKCPKVKVKELLDFRNTLRCNINIRNSKNNLTEDSIIGSVRNVDDIRCTDELLVDNKYYHIRNFGGITTCIIKFMESVSMGEIKEEKFDTLPLYLKDYNQNENETLRLLTWFKIILEKVSTDSKKYDSYMKHLYKLLNCFEIPVDLFEFYVNKTKEFHRTDLL